jgi:hypothetical protein
MGPEVERAGLNVRAAWPIDLTLLDGPRNIEAVYSIQFNVEKPESILRASLLQAFYRHRT